MNLRHPLHSMAMLVPMLAIFLACDFRLAMAAEPLPQDILDAEAQSGSICTLVSPLTGMPVVVIGSAATASEKFAAKELSEHLGTITRREIKVVDETSVPTGAKIIAIGKSKLTDGYDIASLGVEQYLIDVKSDRVVIVGGRTPPVTSADGIEHVNDRGTLYGVYAFLEDLGVRWYRPEPWGWHIPQKETIELPVGNKVSAKPAFMGRTGVRTRSPYADPDQAARMLEQTEVWSARQRLNIRTSEDHWFGGTVSFTANWHTHSRLIVPPGKYLKTNPEYFALVNGERGSSGSGRTPQLCLGNPELQNVFAENVIRLARENPQWYMVAVDPEDGTQLGTRMCTCPLCTAMDDPKNPTVMSNRIFAFTNIIAKRLGEAIPGAKVGLYAYSMHTEVPTLVEKLEPNVIVGLANINSWSDWAKKSYDATSPQNAKFIQLFKDWTKIAPHPVWMREYSAYGWLGPIPMYRYLQDRVQAYRQMGTEGIVWPAEPNWGSQLLLVYLKAKLQWDPDLDLAEELARFYTNYYGPAAAPMKAYHERWMAAFEGTTIGSGVTDGISSGGRGMHAMCSPALIEELGERLKEARALVKDDPIYGRRLKGEEQAWELCWRVSEILTIKLQQGQPTPHPRSAATTYMRSPEAEQAWEALELWLVQVSQGDDVVFDIKVEDGKPSGTALTYMKRDILQNGRFSTWDERPLLESVGFLKK